MSREELRKLAEDLALGPEALRVTRDDASHWRIRMEEDRIGAVDCGDCGAELAPPSTTRRYLPWSVFARGQGVLIQHERTGRIIHACGEFAITPSSWEVTMSQGRWVTVRDYSATPRTCGCCGADIDPLPQTMAVRFDGERLFVRDAITRSLVHACPPIGKTHA